MQANESLDLIIIGGGIGGVISLYYAKKAGLKVLLLEKQGVVGGLWSQLPAWQDIQNNPIDWTLGDIPISGSDQPSIASNIQAWSVFFDAAPDTGKQGEGN
jgi:cation diffusion facilitator CzcD-associated flavoprotein CzcO